MDKQVLRKKLKREKEFEEITDCLQIEAEANEEDKVSLKEKTPDTEVESDEVKDSLMNEAEAPETGLKFEEMKDSLKIEAEAKEGGETSPNKDSSLNQRHQR